MRLTCAHAAVVVARPQDEITDEIRKALEAKLLASNDSRTFAAAGSLQQSQLPFALLPTQPQQQSQEEAGPPGATQAAPYRPEKLVRTDHR